MAFTFLPAIVGWASETKSRATIINLLAFIDRKDFLVLDFGALRALRALGTLMTFGPLMALSTLTTLRTLII